MATLERSTVLDRAGRWLRSQIGVRLRPGFAKDLLSGTWLGHPLHPMLTDVPIGAWTSAAVLDVVGRDRLSPAADALVGVGVLTALPTAVSGLSDLLDIEAADARRVGVAHAVGNVTAVALFGASWFARRTGARRAGRRLSGLGTAVMTASGYLGAHLVYRTGVGVAQTAFQPRLDDWTSVMDAADLPEGEAKLVTVRGVEIMLYRRGGETSALANRCGHRGGPLHKGRVEGTTITCPWHLSRYDLRDGSIRRGPATAPQPSYDVRTTDGRIELRSRS
jgi:nitrite reductase/ring-hydroxylating ferredoxin subunit/uncharacterized membrane protein